MARKSNKTQIEANTQINESVITESSTVVTAENNDNAVVATVVESVSNSTTIASEISSQSNDENPVSDAEDVINEQVIDAITTNEPSPQDDKTAIEQDTNEIDGSSPSDEPVTVNESGNVETLPISGEPEATVVSNGNDSSASSDDKTNIPASDDKGETSQTSQTAEQTSGTTENAQAKETETSGSSSESDAKETTNKDDKSNKDDKDDKDAKENKDDKGEEKAKKKKEKSNKPKEMKLNLVNIVVDQKYQTRVELNNSIVNEYAANMKLEDKFPPIVVFKIDKKYHLVDGFHRYYAYVKANINEVLCRIYVGTERDAKLLAASANADHGLRRSNADKEKSVKMLLDDPEWKGNSDNWIAKATKVSQPTVTKIREKYYPSESSSEKNCSDGRKMETKNLKEKKKKKDEEKEDTSVQSSNTDSENKGSAEQQTNTNPNESGIKVITKPILSSIEKIQPYLNGSVDKVTEFIEALNSHIAACNQSLEAAMGLTKSSTAEATAIA